MSERVNIYGLFDPRTNDCFYVGITKRGLSIRLKQHIREKGTNHFKDITIKEIINNGYYPEIQLLLTVDDYYIEELHINYWQFAEIYAIIYIRDILKHPLVNIAAGGCTCYDNKRNKKIRQYDLDGNYLKSYKSCTYAARTQFKYRPFESCQHSIRECCLGRRTKAYNYLWCYDGNEDKIIEDVIKKRNTPQSYSHSMNMEIKKIIKESRKEKKKEEQRKKIEFNNSPDLKEIKRLKGNKHCREYNKKNRTKLNTYKRNYYQTPEGKLKKREEKRRYSQTPEGKKKIQEQKKRYNERKRLEKIITN